MVWAIDLDDGTLLDALTSGLLRHKELTLEKLPSVVFDFETPWEKDEL